MALICPYCGNSLNHNNCCGEAGHAYEVPGELLEIAEGTGPLSEEAADLIVELKDGRELTPEEEAKFGLV